MRPRLVRSFPLGFRRAAPVLAGLLLAGCGSSHPSSNGGLNPNGTFSAPEAAAPSTSTAPSAIPTKQVYDAVLQRYREYQRVYQQVYETNDPTALSSVMTDPLLSRVTKDVEETKAKGEIWRFTNTVNPRVYGHSKDGTTVYVLDCVKTLAAYRFSATTGKRLGGGPGTSFRYRTSVRYDSGAWKVAETVQERRC